MSPSLDAGILPRPLGRKLPRQCIPRSGEGHAVEARLVSAWRSVLVRLRIRRIPNQNIERSELSGTPLESDTHNRVADLVPTPVRCAAKLNLQLSFRI